jgi:hypothetical protein
MVLFLLVFAILSNLWQAFALMMLCKWFLVPLGLPVVSLPIALGITFIVQLLRGTTSKEEDLAEFFANLDWKGLILSPAVAIAVGYIVHLFM